MRSRMSGFSLAAILAAACEPGAEDGIAELQLDEAALSSAPLQIVTIAGGGPTVPAGTTSPLIHDPIGRIRVDAPASIAGEYLGREPIATPPLCDPERHAGCQPLSAEVVDFGAACDNEERFTSLPADALAGKIALVTRAGCLLPPPPTCTSPIGCNPNGFANKIVLAGSKGARGVIVTNNVIVPSDALADRSTLMVMTWGNFADPEVVPALFVTKGTGDVLRGALAAGETVRVTMLGGWSLGDHGPATAAQFRFPSAAVFDAYGYLFVSDHRIHKVRRIAPDGTIITIAGSQRPRLSGDGGPARDATLFIQHGLAFDRFGNLFIADQANHRIRKVQARPGLPIDGSEIITTVAGSGPGGLCVVPNPVPGSCIVRGDLVDATPATSGRLDMPLSLAFDRHGNLFFTQQPAPGLTVGKLRKITARRAPDGTSLAIDGSEPLETVADVAGFTFGLAFDRHDNLYVARSWPGASPNVLKLVPSPGPDGRLEIRGGESQEVVVGTSAIGFGGDEGPASSAQLSDVANLSFDAAGNLYVPDPGNHRVRKVTARRRVVGGVDLGPEPLDGSEIITTIAGSGTPGFGGDGMDPLQARLSFPFATASAGSLIIADGENHRLRRLNRLVGVTLQPTELSLRSRGRWITGTLAIADAGATSIRAVRLQRLDPMGAVRDEVAADVVRYEDVDADGDVDAVAKFPRATVQSWGAAGESIAVRLEGELLDPGAPGPGQHASGETVLLLTD